MAGVYHFLVYMQTAPKYNAFYIHHHGVAQRPRAGVYPTGYFGVFAYTPAIFLVFQGPNPVVEYIESTLYFGAVCIYTKEWYTPTIFFFFLSPNPVVLKKTKGSQNRVCLVGVGVFCAILEPSNAHIR